MASITASIATMQEEATPDSFPIAQAATENARPAPHGETEERPNKYFYSEFSGYSGERYLDSLIQQILPSALHRTWWYAVDYQAPGSECYVGTARLANRVKPGIRKIELDFQELEARGLMRRYSAVLPVMQDDGSTRMKAVTVKDFRALYDLAHEYHLWLKSDEYIPPNREYREIFVENLKLLAKLVRFDCYRRVVECAKPGRKPQVQPQHYYYHYHCSQQAAEPPTEAPRSPERVEEHHDRVSSPQDAESEEICHALAPRTLDQNANLFSISSDKDSSAYRESESKNLLAPSNSDSNHFERGIPGVAIGNASEIESYAALEMNVEDTGKPNKSDNASKSKTPNPSQKENGPARARQVEEDETLDIGQLKQDPFALATKLAEMHIREQQTLKAVKAPRRPDQRQRRGTPEPLARRIAYYMQKLSGNPNNLQSDVTRATKLYWTITQVYENFSNKWFAEQLEQAFEKAVHKRKVGNRPAYFFTCLTNRFQLAPAERAYCLSEEPLYQDGLLSDYLHDLRREYARSGSTTEYNAWVRREILKEQPRL